MGCPICLRTRKVGIHLHPPGFALKPLRGSLAWRVPAAGLFTMIAPPHRLRRLHRLAAVLAVLSGAAGLLRAQFESSAPTLPDRERAPLPTTAPLPIFFPPNLPPLDRPLSRLTSVSSGLTLSAPAELALYPTESFYAPLSTRLAGHPLDERKRERLLAYRTARDALIDELRMELTRTQEAGPAQRRTALAALAQRDAPRLAELEAAEERLRDDLIVGGGDWRDLRDWRLGERNTRGDSPAELAAVLRANAFYQAGLLPEQRQLLREIVIEVTSGAENATAASERQPFLFFSPAFTRLKLPDTLPTEVSAKFGLFESQKSALKKELFDAVVSQDRAVFGFQRTNAMKALAARQAPILTELESLADEIRDSLASLPEVAPPVLRSPLPPLLTQRVMVIVAARSTLQKATRAKVDAIAAELPADFPVSLGTVVDRGGVKVRLIPRETARRPLRQNDPLLNAIALRIKEVSDEHRQQNDTLDREVDALRDDVGRVLGPGATPKQIDEALSAAVLYGLQMENVDGYHEYRLAAFEPGLSAAQRRLLIGAAARKLDLPLPGGEMQPIGRSDKW